MEKASGLAFGTHFPNFASPAHGARGFMALHNRVSRSELKKKAASDGVPRITLSFYRYTPFSDPASFRNALYRGLEKLGVFGRIYVAPEGINGQVAVARNQFGPFKDFLYSFPFLEGMRLNRAIEEGSKSFWMLQVKIRPKIVADGITDPDFSMSRAGRYVDAPAFNRLTEDPGTILVDMRNHYEYEVGHFEGALALPSGTFREQLPLALDQLKDFKDQPVVLYCTGGIRCEKASAYLLHHGFSQVYHLEGGITEYARRVAAENLPNKFRGKNFVFDGRMGERVSGEIISHCHQCGQPCDTHTNCSNPACHLLFIQCPDCARKYSGCCSPECLRIINLPAGEQKALRQGKNRGPVNAGASGRRLRGKVNPFSSGGNP